MSGNSTTTVPGVYGTKGVPSVSNYPGSRLRHSMVFHPLINCLFVFGGGGNGASTAQGLFDVSSVESNQFK